MQQRVRQAARPHHVSVGPPGVGGDFARIEHRPLGRTVSSCAGMRRSAAVRDEAEIRGHQRTYIGLDARQDRAERPCRRRAYTTRCSSWTKSTRCRWTLRGRPSSSALLEGFGSGAEHDVQRPLPRGRSRPVGSDVCLHGEFVEYSGSAVGSYGSSSLGLLGYTEDEKIEHRPALPRAEADRRTTA